MSGLRFLAAHASVLLALAATAYVAGRLALRAALRDVDLEVLGRPAVASTLGLLVLATSGALLGLAGHLTRPALLGLAGAIHLAGFPIWRELATDRAPAKWTLRVLLSTVIAAVLVAPLFVLAIYPPTAFDETLYHLPFARAFLETGGLPFLPELRFPVFPQLGEVLSAEVLGFSGDTATHLVSLLAVGLTAALLWTWGGQWGGEPGGMDRPMAQRIGWLAAAAWLGNPIVTYLGGTGYVEPLLALFVTAGSYAFWNWRRGGRRGWLVLSGLFVGAAAGTKYLGLFFVVTLAVSTLRARPLIPLAPPVPASPPARRLGDLLLFVVAAGVVMAPWYGRILAWTGNPVFPFLSGIFGGNDWTPVHFRNLHVPPRASDWIVGLGEGAKRLATLPWDVVARRGLVGGLPPFSLAYLLGLPLLAAAAVRDRARGSLRSLRSLLLPAVFFVLLVPALPADSRYLVTVLPLFSLGLGVALADWSHRGWWSRRRAQRAVTASLALLLALPGWLYAAYRIAIQGPLPTGPVDREAYLLRTLPFYPAVARVNELLRPGDVVYGLHVESMRYFVRGEFLGDWYGPHRFALLEDRLQDRLADPAALAATLMSWGVDYVVVNRRSAAAAVLASGNSDLERVFEDRAALVYALAPRIGGE